MNVEELRSIIRKAKEQAILEERERILKILERAKYKDEWGMIVITCDWEGLKKEITSPEKNSPQDKTPVSKNQADGLLPEPSRDDRHKTADTHISKAEVARVIDKVFPRCICKNDNLNLQCPNEFISGLWSDGLNKEIKKELGLSSSEDKKT